jgi:hypothetical protein
MRADGRAEYDREDKMQAYYVSPLNVSGDDIKKLLADAGVNNIEDLVKAIQQSASTPSQSGGIGRIAPMASWVLKFIRLD